MKSMENNLSTALSNSLTNEVETIVTAIVESGLDSVMADGILKEIPILSTAVSMYKAGNSFKEQHQIEKLASFVMALNNGIIDEEKRKHYKAAIKDAPKQRDQELKYILILVDRYINSDKAKMLAKLYLAYLDENIDWNTFSKASDVLDRLLPGDFQELEKCHWFDLEDSAVSDALLRLISLGLVVSHNKGAKAANTVGTIVIPDSTIKDYELTNFGQTFLRCLSEYD